MVRVCKTRGREESHFELSRKLNGPERKPRLQEICHPGLNLAGRTGLVLAHLVSARLVMDSDDRRNRFGFSGRRTGGCHLAERDEYIGGSGLGRLRMHMRIVARRDRG
jgi:hypothetical protein